MITKIEPEYRALHRIADRLSPLMRRAFLDAVQQLRERIDPQRLLQLIAAGDQGNLGAFWRAYEQEMGGVFRPVIRDTLLGAADLTGTRLGVGTSFDLTNPHAVQLIDTHTTLLVRGITDESRAAIQEVLRQGFLGNADVPEMARRIRNSIGLTPQYATAVENYRRGQLAAGVPPGKVDRQADRYAQELLNLRATTIARTETIRAANLGQQAVWEDARRNGFVSPEARRIWIVTPDDRLCPICEAIADDNQDGVGLTEPFDSEVGALMTPPAHPNCRCAIGLQYPEEP